MPIERTAPKRPTPSNLTTLTLVAMAVLAAVSALVYPIATYEAPEGVVLARATAEAMAPGEHVEIPFEIAPGDDWERIGLSYIITDAAHLRATFDGPNGERSHGRAAGGELRLEAFDPSPGAWTLRIETLDRPGQRGHVDGAEFIVLGFAS